MTMMKNNFQSHIMLRLLGVISLVMGAVCVITLFLASLVPTQLLVATASTLTSDHQRLAIVDGYTNRHLYLDYPLSIAQQQAIARVDLSDNGRFARIYHHNGVHHEVSFWDIFGGRVIHLPPDFCPQGVSINSGTGFSDSRKILFVCEAVDDNILAYWFDFETQESTLQYSYQVTRPPFRPTPLTTITTRSIDGSWTAQLDLETRQISISHADQSEPIEIISPYSPYLITWHPNSQSLFVLSENRLEQYMLNDQSWETIATDIQMPFDMNNFETYMQFSPNMEWVILFNGIFKQGYIINLVTHQMIFIDESSPSIFRPQFWWSPDSQWIVMATFNEQQLPETYLMRPDLSEVTYFTDMVLNGVYWSPDSMEFVYRIYTDDDYLYRVALDSLSPQLLGFRLELGEVRWSENGDSFAYVSFLRRGRRHHTQLGYVQGNDELVFLLDYEDVVYQVEFVR
jgi:hypothetical protein